MISGPCRRQAKEGKKGLDHLEGDNVGGDKVRKVYWLEWEVFQGHGSGGGWSRESEEGDDR